MSDHQVAGVGRAIVLIGALLELRHLALAVLEQFEGCRDLNAVVARAAVLDDATLVGVAACAILAGAVLAAYIPRRRPRHD